MNDKIEQQKNHFNKVSELYYKARQNKNHLYYKKLLWQYFLDGNKNIFINKFKCLEAMCGYGEGHDILIDNSINNFEYTGFDYSNELVDLVKNIRPELKILHENILSFKSVEKYDLIIIIGGLHHVYSNAKEALLSMYNVNKFDGYFINFEPTQNNILFKIIRKFLYKKNSLFDNNTEQGFDLNELNNLFVNTGYVLVDQIYPGLLCYILYYNPDAFPWLNIGNNKIINFLFRIEKYFYKNIIGKYLSFATISIWKKNKI